MAFPTAGDDRHGMRDDELGAGIKRAWNSGAPTPVFLLKNWLPDTENPQGCKLGAGADKMRQQDPGYDRDLMDGIGLKKEE